MTPLLLHIEYLLRSHDCVIVPSLGAFIASRRPACFNRQAAVILPPCTEIMFNASITNNDGLIANSIARRMDMPYPQALAQLDAWTAELTAQLHSERQVNLGSLGSLSLGDDDNIIFTPSAESRITAEHSGLAAIAMSSGKKEEETALTKQPMRLRSDKYYYIPIHKTFARVAAMFVIVFTMALLFITPSSVTDATRQDCASVLPMAVDHGKKAAAKPAAAPAKTKAAATTDVAKAEPQTEQYHLVVGTFTDADEAARFVQRHSGSGYELRTVSGTRYIRVTAARNANKKAVVELLQSEDIKGAFPGAWVWKN